MNKRLVGREKEELAACWLEARGCQILEKEYSTPYGEIDLIMYDAEEVLCFVEVKYRKNAGLGYPAEAVDGRKILHICRSADHYRRQHHARADAAMRFDVISILGGNISWIRNAFDYNPGW